MPMGLFSVTGSRWKSGGGATCLWVGESGSAQSGIAIPGAWACAADAQNSRRLAYLAGRIFHHHIEHIGRQMRGKTDPDIKGPAGLEGDGRAFGMDRLTLPADPELEQIAFFLDP